MKKQTTLNSYEASAQQYAEKTASLFPKNQGERFLKLLPKKAKILDLGCACGRDAKIFSELGLEVVGIDFSPKMIEIAKQAAPRATFHVMDIESLQFPAMSFDGVWANSSLLHIPKKNIPAVLKNLHTILKQKGILFISVKEGTDERTEKDPRYDGLEKFWSFFQEDELKKNLTDAGFIIVSHWIIDKMGAYQTHPKVEMFVTK